MRNLWLVARHAYRRTVVRRAFLLLTLAIPAGIALLIGLIVLVEVTGRDKRPVGYVDLAGWLEPVPASAVTGPAPPQALPDRETGQAALEEGAIQALFVLPADYPASLAVELYYRQDLPDRETWAAFDDFLRANLVREIPPAQATRLLEGPAIRVVDVDNGRTFDRTAVANIAVPFVATAFFFLATMSASGYMLQVVAEEKENRTMEVMLTAVTPGQLILGKSIGLLAAALTQLALYVAAGVFSLLAAAPYVPALQTVIIPWGFLGLLLLYFLPSYALIAAMMVAIGAAVGELEQGQQVAGLLNLLFLLPLFVVLPIVENVAGPVAVALTLFPTTSFLTVALRWGLGSVPVWQLIASWLILIAAVLATVWLAARVFRLGMLRYCQPLRLRHLLAGRRAPGPQS